MADAVAADRVGAGAGKGEVVGLCARRLRVGRYEPKQCLGRGPAPPTDDLPASLSTPFVARDAPTAAHGSSGAAHRRTHLRSDRRHELPQLRCQLTSNAAGRPTDWPELLEALFSSARGVGSRDGIRIRDLRVISPDRQPGKPAGPPRSLQAAASPRALASHHKTSMP